MGGGEGGIRTREGQGPYTLSRRACSATPAPLRGTTLRLRFFQTAGCSQVQGGDCRPGGEGGIRTHGPVTRTPLFESGALNRSATSPGQASLRRLPYSTALSASPARCVCQERCSRRKARESSPPFPGCGRLGWGRSTSAMGTTARAAGSCHDGPPSKELRKGRRGSGIAWARDLPPRKQAQLDGSATGPLGASSASLLAVAP